MKARFAIAVGLVLISTALAHAPSGSSRLVLSGYGCVSKQKFVTLDSLAMSGDFQAYRNAQARALASDACATFDKGQSVVLDQTESVDIPGFGNATIIQVHMPGRTLKYWMLGIQLWGSG